MRNKEDPLPVEEKLEEINAATAAKRNAPKIIRRAMEAQIEARAKKRRDREVAAASAAVKK